MLKVSDDTVEKLMQYLRVSNSSAEDEITDLGNACIEELDVSGVYVTDDTDPLTLQAIKLYCKAHFGYDEDVERFQRAFESLRDCMALSGEYEKGE